MEQEEGSVYNDEDEVKDNADRNVDVSVIENSETQVEAPEDEAPKNPNAKWYILQAYAGYEGRVEQTINEKLKIEGLEHLVDEIFIPSEDVVRTKDGQKRKVNQNIFRICPCADGTDTGIVAPVDGVNRVSGFIGGTQMNPLPLDETELEKIRSQISEGSQQKATEDEFLVGQKVTITEGSFGNFSGTIDEINQERRKLKVLVSIFGRPTPVEVEFDKVKHVFRIIFLVWQEISSFIKLQIPAGKSKPFSAYRSGIGPAWSKHNGFLQSLQCTNSRAGHHYSCHYNSFSDRSFTFITKTPPVPVLIRQALKLEKGSSTPNVEKVGTLTREQIEEIAKQKEMPDLNCYSLEAAVKSVAGTARSMGVLTRET